jgi:RNA methyltransferase, TrmH family
MSQLSQQFLSSYRTKTIAYLAGFHPLKNALRFRANVISCITDNKQNIIDKAQTFCPDILDQLEIQLLEVTTEEFDACLKFPVHSRVLTLVEIPESQTPVESNNYSLFLDNIEREDNFGLIVRVAAAAGVENIFVKSNINLWSAQALRASRGLHFGINIIQVSQLPAGYNYIAFDERGQDYKVVKYPQNSLLIFGSEGSGISPGIRQEIQQLVKIPMTDKISSLNIATAVAIALYK